jgi:hypothetical protein
VTNERGRFFSRCYNSRGVKLVPQPHLMPRLKMSGAILPLPPHIPKERGSSLQCQPCNKQIPSLYCQDQSREIVQQKLHKHSLSAIHFFMLKHKCTGYSGTLNWEGKAYGMHNQILAVRLWAGPKDLAFLRRVQIASGANTPSHWMGNGGSYPRYKSAVVWKMITRIHLAPRLRTSGTIPSFLHSPSWRS